MSRRSYDLQPREAPCDLRSLTTLKRSNSRNAPICAPLRRPELMLRMKSTGTHQCRKHEIIPRAAQNQAKKAKNPSPAAAGMGTAGPPRFTDTPRSGRL
jgi:hypothetical protein